MSHFKVLVIGDDIETQLAPYDENLETVAYKDTDYDHESRLKSARDFYTLNADIQKDLDRNDDRAILTAYSDGEDLRWNEGGTSELWSTYNPKSKWDYWVIGGRYNASMKIKPGADSADFKPSERHWSEGFGNESDHVKASDQARKNSIDYPAMIEAQRQDAEQRWEKLAKATDGIEPPTSSWAEIRERHDNMESARAEYNGHPWNKAAFKAGFWSAYDDFRMSAEDPRAAYIAEREAGAVAGYYAVVHNGEWTGRGDMGWFGMSSNDADKSEWMAKVRDLIDGLPDDTWLTTVDCHI